MTTLMSIPAQSRLATGARAHPLATSLSLSAALGEQLSTLYSLAERSAHVFGTPLGPFTHAGRNHYLPRFVYFGPHTSEESPRLAFLAGLDSRDLRPTLALLHLLEELALRPALGQSLHLAFYPLVDVLGHLQQAGVRDLSADRWTTPEHPEIELLARDSRLQTYHAFIRIESAPADDVVTMRLRASGGAVSHRPLFSSEDTEPYPVRWEIESGPRATGGPLSQGEDLRFRPLDLTLRVPANWAPDLYREAVASILKRFIIRYRSLLAYGQHL
jgi:hypothetical protein